MSKGTKEGKRKQMGEVRDSDGEKESQTVTEREKEGKKRKIEKIELQGYFPPQVLTF